MEQKSYTGWKDIVVFISSTFNDMHAERDYLVKFVFPELREWCAERKLRLKDIDLRWGITASDNETKQTLGICLRDIDESRPFFLGFLGQRRGWQPGEEDVDDGTLREYPQLSALLGKASVTEMEIEHAMLQPLLRMADGAALNPSPAAHAFVFLRDDPFAGKLSPAQQRIYTNRGEASPDEDPSASASVRKADENLAAFRARLEKQVSDVRHYQADFDPSVPSPELGGMDSEEGRGRLVNFRVGNEPLKDVVIREMKSAILEEYPERLEPAPESTAEELRSLFLEKMAEGYIERPRDLEALESYLSAPSCRGPLLVHAASGAGKTTLLAEFYRRLKTRGVPVQMRVCGVGREDSSVLGVFSSIFSALGIPLPMDTEELKERIASYTEQLATAGAVLLIDALDQIPGGPEVLSWLPAEWPEGLRIIFSIRDNALEGDLHPETLSGRGVRLYEVLPFDTDTDRQLLVDGYLRSHLKKLDKEHTELLFRKKGASNPLYLLAALSELRLEGRFDRIAARIASLGEGPEAVFDGMLARMEQDWLDPELTGTQMVPMLFAALSESRSGLTRDELHRFFALAFPQADREAMDGLVQVYLRQIRDFLTQFSGVTDLRYFALRRAASARYSALRQKVNELLAACFLERIGPDYDSGTARDYEEGIVHLIRADASAALYVLTDYRFMRSKLRLCGIRNLLGDFGLLESSYPSLPDEKAVMLSGALRNAVYILEKNPEELAGQLAMRVPLADFPRLADQLDVCETDLWLRVHALLNGSRNYKILRVGETGVHSVWPCHEDILAVYTDGRAELISERDGRLLRVIREGGLELTAAVLYRENLYLADAAGKVSCYEVRTGKRLCGTEAKSTVRILAADEGKVFGADGQESVYVWDTDTLKQTGGMRMPGGASALYAGEGILAVGGRREKILVYSSSTLKPVCSHDPQAGSVWAFAKVGDCLYIACDLTLLCLSLESGLFIGGSAYCEVGDTLQLLPLNTSASSLFPGQATALYNFCGNVASCFDLKLTQGESVSGILPTVRFMSGKNRQLYFATVDGRIGIMDERSLKQNVVGSEGSARTVCFSSAAVAILNSGRTIRLYSRETGDMLMDKDYVPLAADRGQSPYRFHHVFSITSAGDSFFVGTTGELLRLDRWGRTVETLYHKDYGGIFDPMGAIEPVAANSRYIAWCQYGELKIRPRSGSGETVLDKGAKSRSLLMTEDRLYSFASGALTAYRLDRPDFPHVTSSVPEGWTKPETGRNILLLGYSDRILALDPDTGESRGEFFTGSVADFTFCNGFLFVLPGDYSIGVYRDGRFLYSLTTDEIPTALTSDRETGDVMAGTASAGYMRLRIENPDHTERTVTRPEPAHVPAGVIAESKRLPPDITRRGPVLAIVIALALLGLLFAGLGSWKANEAVKELYPAQYAENLASVQEGRRSLTTLNWANEWFMFKRLPLIPAISMLFWFWCRFHRVKEDSWWHWTGREIPRTAMWSLACVLYGILCLRLSAAGELSRLETAHVIFSCSCLLLVIPPLLTFWIRKEYTPVFGSKYAKRCVLWNITAVIGLLTAAAIWFFV